MHRLNEWVHVKQFGIMAREGKGLCCGSLITVGTWSPVLHDSLSMLLASMADPFSVMVALLS